MEKEENKTTTASKDVPSEKGKKEEKAKAPVETTTETKTEEKPVAKTEEKPVAKTEEKQKKSNKKEKETGDNIAPREYVVPMRREFLKAPEYRKSKKAVKALKQFLAKHMKVVDRDLKKVKVDIYLNNEIWYRGIRKPLPKIKVIAEKKDGIVYAKLAEVPEIVKFKMARDERRLNKVDKKAVEKVKKQEESEKAVKEARSDKQDPEVEKKVETASVAAKEFAQKASSKIEKNKTDAKPNMADVSISGKQTLSK